MKFTFENSSLPANAIIGNEFAHDFNINIPTGTRGSTNGEGGCAAEMWIWRDAIHGWIAAVGFPIVGYTWELTKIPTPTFRVTYKVLGRKIGKFDTEYTPNHLVFDTQDEAENVADQYRKLGFKNVYVLKNDPSTSEFTSPQL